MVDVRGDVLRPPHGTTPAAVKANKNHKMSSFKSNENIHKKGESCPYLDRCKNVSLQRTLPLWHKMTHHQLDIFED